MRRALLVAVCSSVTACGPGHAPALGGTDADPTTSTTATATTRASTTSEGDTDTSTTGPGGTAYEDDGAGPGCSFTCPPAPSPGGGGGFVECDIYQQDCPTGEKCVAWANDGGSFFNTWRCAPLAPDAVSPPAQCQVAGSFVSGIDDCDIGTQCLPGDPIDAAEGRGRCASLCATGCPDDNESCVVLYDGVLPLCTRACDPLSWSDCDPGWVCAARSPWPQTATFVCQPRLHPAPAGPFEPCEYTIGCNPGLYCGPSFREGFLGMCLPLCSPNKRLPEACVGASLDCLPLPTPPGSQWDGLGACAPSL